jgi:NAD(P)H dehydrogenase (quinone)
MSKILVIYASDYGSTEKAAQKIAEGARAVEGTEVEVKKALEVTPEDMSAADGIIAGSPTHMGSMHWELKKWIDEVCGGLWMKDALVGKVGAVFGTGGGYGNAGGGCELTMLSLLNNFAELGLILVPLPRNTPGYDKAGLQWGPYARAHTEQGQPVGVKEEQLESFMNHGANVARIAKVAQQHSFFPKP